MSLTDFLRGTRANMRLIQIPVTIMSSPAFEPGEKSIPQALGAANYLRKPIDLDLLLRTVDAHRSEN